MVALRAALFVLLILAIPVDRAGTYGPWAGNVHAQAVGQPEVAEVVTVAAGDFDRDGHVDLLRRHITTGELWVLFLDGPTIDHWAATAPFGMSMGWNVRGTGDFNGDGYADILWQDETGSLLVWHMQGATMESSGIIETADVTDASWTVSATGDFNNDGDVDLLWRHSGSGQLAVWFMEKRTRLGGTLTTVSYTHLTLPTILRV